MDIVKNTTKLNIKNVICFYITKEAPDSIDIVKTKKETDWSYQDYLTSACDKKKYNLYWLNKNTVYYTNNETNIHIIDRDLDFSLDKDNIKDTVIFQGQANDSIGKNYIGLMTAFELFGFYVINNINSIITASDKWLAYSWMKNIGVPQPNTVIITKDIMEDGENKISKDIFFKILDSVYPSGQDIDVAPDNMSDVKYVCKILNGSLGIGVFVVKRSEIEGVLQAMFEIAPDTAFVIQEFKQNTGDIRVHAFSVDGKKYDIIAVMKRDKISGDFRSNVSLGASTEKYNLSDKQKDIVLKTAKYTGCKWVGIDLMHCEDGNDYVIEYNSSPGVQGISQQIKKNLFLIIFDKLEDYFKKYQLTGKQEKYNHEVYSTYLPSFVSMLKDNWEELKLSEQRVKVLNTCLDVQPGTHYKLHGKDNPYDGLDCSGYVKWVYRQAGINNLPDMCIDWFTVLSDSNWYKIDKKDLLPGDIGVKNESTIDNHCGIYAGNGKWFESNLFYGVQLTDYDKFKYFFRVKGID